MAAALSRRLWEQQQPLASAILHHPFVRAIGKGSLPASSFREYVSQDAFFLRAFARAYALAQAKAADPRTAERIGGMISAVEEELKLHAHTAAVMGIDLDKVEPSPACLAYTTFLLDTAQDPKASIAEVMAAMCPCMRLYAFLGQSLARASGALLAPTKTRPSTLQAWINTYASEDFEQGAAAVESLLDEEAKSPRGAEGGRSLAMLYRRAMELEYDFFDEHAGKGEWRGLRPSLLVVDFDGTCTHADTTHVLAKIAERFPPAKDPSLWRQLEDRYLQRLSAFLPTLLLEPLPPADLPKHLEPLDEFEGLAVADVSATHVLAGIPRAQLPSLLSSDPCRPLLALKRHCLPLLNKARPKPLVLSVSWCEDMVSAVLGIPLERIVANRLDYDPHHPHTSTGLVHQVVTGPGGKLKEWVRLTEGVEGPTVYIGDSVTDMLVLLRAQCGILIGGSRTFRSIAEPLGVKIVPLLAYPVDPAVGPVVYEVESWAEIAAFLYGKEGAEWVQEGEAEEQC